MMFVFGTVTYARAIVIGQARWSTGKDVCTSKRDIVGSNPARSASYVCQCIREKSKRTLIVSRNISFK